jgi:hypothetical protein
MAQDTVKDKAQHFDATVGVGKPEVHWLRKRKVLVVVAVVIVVAIVVAVWLYMRPPGRDMAAENAEIATLQSSLDTATSNADYQGVINITSQLINGAKNGSFSLSNSQLALYHTDRAEAYLGQNQYALVTPDCEATVSLDSSQKLAALEIEFEARYKLGDRQQLIPILQEIISLAKNNGGSGNIDAVQQYQQDIQSIQQNQEISF